MLTAKHFVAMAFIGSDFFCSRALANSFDVFHDARGAYVFSIPYSDSAALSCSFGPRQKRASQIYHDPRVQGLADSPVSVGLDERWGKDWKKLLRFLGKGIGRVSLEQSGYAYHPLESAHPAFEIGESDNRLVAIALGFADWLSEPTTLLSDSTTIQYVLPAPPQVARSVFELVSGDGYVDRLGLTIKQDRSNETNLADRAAIALSSALGDFLFPVPAYLAKQPSADDVRSYLEYSHTRTVDALARLANGTGEFAGFKISQDAIKSLGIPDLQLSLDDLRKAEEQALSKRLSNRVASSTRTRGYFGAGANRPSAEKLGFVDNQELAKDSTVCGITDLEIRAVFLMGELARAHARIKLSEIMRSGSGLEIDSSASFDEQTKLLAREFLANVSAAVARRAAYEFFLVYTYRTSVVRGAYRVKVSPILSGREEKNTLAAEAYAARLLELVQDISSGRAPR
ncbi:hypothetical protein [Rudaea cellulosilytica]|uniref:hypothetical protein n=1 Tax=Rudaea cellulosilytica TaxID=540746 RepID=UPI00039FF34D|nr:hypothetical protein [Rudaea cellulosilytica]